MGCWDRTRCVETRGLARPLSSDLGAKPTDLEIHLDSGRCEHPHQGVDAEQLDLPAYEVAHPGLRHAKECCGIALPEPIPSDDIAHRFHEFGANSEMRFRRHTSRDQLLRERYI
jgi:hypothetical protein